eukprot:Plantae.Rhodophyta-Hildenbrandia_rubra.ctg4177.p2 GENE.Plantae.Rhodophyta-Hildenbrandia_rubra.ctg4177~~Plantae.Rhodophyta-Hildenbrandia_rubra.ctg4177.p2  ORF type:complete len:560 (+),score=90.20 Plantae.Rhodophyta-Hildenbrandia_rubra.ctg4177:405-2084(+)
MEIDKEESGSNSERASASNAPSDTLNLTIRIPYTENEHTTTAAAATLVGNVVESIPTSLAPVSQNNQSAPNRLIFQGQILDSTHSLSHYNIPDNAVLHLIPPPPQRPPPSPRNPREDTPDEESENGGFHHHFHHSFFVDGVNVNINGIGYEPTRDLISTILESLYTPSQTARHAAIAASTIVATTPRSAWNLTRDFVSRLPGNNPQLPPLPSQPPESMQDTLQALLPYVGASLVQLGTALMAGNNAEETMVNMMPRPGLRTNLFPFILHTAASTLSALGVLAMQSSRASQDNDSAESQGSEEDVDMSDGMDGDDDDDSEEVEDGELTRDEIQELVERLCSDEGRNEADAHDRMTREDDDNLNRVLDQFERENKSQAIHQNASSPNCEVPRASQSTAVPRSRGTPGPAGGVGLAASLGVPSTKKKESTRVRDEFSTVLSLPEALKWRRIVAADARKLANAQKQPLSRGYRGLFDSVPQLDPGMAAKQSAGIMQEALNSPNLKNAGIKPEDCSRLVDAAQSEGIGALYEKELESAIAGQLSNDPNFDSSLHRSASKRFRSH